MHIEQQSVNRDIGYQPPDEQQNPPPTMRVKRLWMLKRARPSTEIESQKRLCQEITCLPTTLNTLFPELFLHICNYLDADSLQLASVNRQLYTFFKNSILNIRRIGYQSLIKILCIEQKAFREGMSLYRPPLLPADHLAITMISLAKVSTSQVWLPELQRVFPSMHTCILGAGQFRQLAEANQEIAISYLSFLLAKRPSFPPLENMQEEYTTYVEDTVSLMEVFKSFEKKPNCASWLSEFGNDWGIGEFSASEENLPALLHQFVSEQLATQPKALRNVLYDDSAQKHLANTYLHIILSSTLCEDPTLCFAALQKMATLQVDDIYPAFSLLLESLFKHPPLATKTLATCLDFFRHRNPHQWMLGQDADDASLLSLLATVNLPAAWLLASDLTVPLDRHKAALDLIPIVLAKEPAAACQLLQLIHSIEPSKATTDYPTAGIVVKILLGEFLQKIEAGEVHSALVLPVVKELCCQLRVCHGDTQPGIYVEKWEYAPIMASLFHFLAFYHPTEAPSLFEEVIEHVMEAKDMASMVECAKAFLHLDADHIAFLMTYDFGDKIQGVFDQLIYKSHALALVVALTYHLQNSHRLDLLTSLVKHLDVDTCQKDRAIATHIALCFKQMPYAGGKKLDAFYYALSFQIATFNFTAACELAARIADNHLRASAFLSIYASCPLEFKAAVRLDQQTAMQAIVVADSSIETWLNRWQALAILDSEKASEDLRTLIFSCNNFHSQQFDGAWSTIQALYNSFRHSPIKNNQIVYQFFNILAALAEELDDYAPQKLQILTWLRDQAL